LNRTQRRRGRIILQGKTKRQQTFSKLPQRFKTLEKEEKLGMTSKDSRNWKTNRLLTRRKGK